MKYCKVILFSILFVLTFGISNTAFPVIAAESTIDMIDMHNSGTSNVNEVTDGITDSYGKTYNNNILQFETGQWAYISYDLNGCYTNFSATVVCPNYTGSNAAIDIAFFGDGVLLSEIKDYSRQKPAESLDIDVSGVGTLEIRTRGTDDWDSDVCFVNSTFKKSETPTTFPNRTKLADLVVIDSQNAKCSTGLLIDNFGDFHDGWVKFDSGKDNCYILFNLEKSYELLTGCIVAGDSMESEDSASFTFYLDDEEIMKKENISRTSIINFEINVKNAAVLKIVASGTDYWDCKAYIGNPILKAHEHIPGEWEIEKDSTCTETGQKVQKCSECGETINTEDIPATGHKPESKWTITKEPNCTEYGEQIKKCTVCENSAESEKIDPTGHTPSGNWAYFEEGKCKKVQFCTVCGDVALEQTDSEIEHTPSGEWVITKEATCDHEGERVQYCKICGETISIEIVPITEHDYGKWKTIDGSIWNNPIVKERTCSICSDVERSESSPTSWLKPLIVVLLIIIIGGFAVILVTLKMNGLPLELASIKKLFSKEALSDTDIENLLNKPDSKNHKN